MPTVHEFCKYLETFAPVRLAEDWDNVGLLIGDRDRSVSRAMTCLTITPESVDEAVQREAQLIVTHHPMPFRALKRITTGDVTGAMLTKLIENRVAVYSPHTAFDSAMGGINQSLAEGLKLIDPKPLEPIDGDPDQLGAGRYGDLASHISLAEFVAQTKKFLGLVGIRYVGKPDQTVSRVAVACGSAGQFLKLAGKQGCDAFVTGETNFHTCLEAKATNVALVLPGHYASERFAVEILADLLRKEFADVDVWPSNEESDPLTWA